MPINDVCEGDELVVRTGSMIPLDSIVVSGEAAINQASLTGESLPVHKSQGSYVYAGTVVEDGSLVIKVDKVSGSGKYDRIVKMIEESEKLKSAAESKASTLADKLVPYCLGGTVLTYLRTQSRVDTNGRFFVCAQACNAYLRDKRNERMRRKGHHRQGRKVP